MCNNFLTRDCTGCNKCDLFPAAEPVAKTATQVALEQEAQQMEVAYFRDTYEGAKRQAKLLGLNIVLPKPNELQIDIDNGEQYALFDQNISILAEHFSIRNEDIKIAPSKSGLPKRHITITFPHELEDFERIALQAALGSDPKRELLNCVRALQGQDNPVLFFEAADFTPKVAA